MGQHRVVSTHENPTIRVNTDPTYLLNRSRFLNPNTTHLLNRSVVLTCLSKYKKIKKETNKYFFNIKFKINK